MNDANGASVAHIRSTCKAKLTRITEILQEFQAFFEAGENGEFAVERILAKVQVEDGNVVDFARLPVRISHGDLIKICGRVKHPDKDKQYLLK